MGFGEFQRMFGRHKDPHSSVYLLADHLDAILARGEDLLVLQCDLVGVRRARNAEQLALAHAGVGEFIAAAGSLEISLAAHLRQARLHAKEVARGDKRFASLIRLFLSGTENVQEALADYAAPDARMFDQGQDPIAYLRERALIGEETPGLADIMTLQPTEDMLIAGKIELGALLDLVSAFLNSLDLAYELYPEPVSVTGRPSVTKTAAIVAGTGAARAEASRPASASVKPPPEPRAVKSAKPASQDKSKTKHQGGAAKPKSLAGALAELKDGDAFGGGL